MLGGYLNGEPDVDLRKIIMERAVHVPIYTFQSSASLVMTIDQKASKDSCHVSGDFHGDIWF
jgi:hypothetical protein